MSRSVSLLHTKTEIKIKMNWSGGYKNRFRTNTEVRKAAFQQQSRIILVDLVKHEGDNDNEQTSHISENKKQMFSTTSPISDTSNDISMQQCGTPFKCIPCGTSSDSEECENDDISNTNYSPYSSDQETAVLTTSEESIAIHQSSLLFEEHYENSAVKLHIETQESSQSSCGLPRNSRVGCSTSPPFPTQDFHYLTQNLSFLTPVTNCRNSVAYSTLDHQHERDGNPCLPYPAIVNKDKAVVRNNSFHITSTDVSKTPLRLNCSSSLPEDVIPAPEKQLHLYSPAEESSVEYRIAAMSQGNQINVPLTLMINEYCEKPAADGEIVPRKHHGFRCNSHCSQSVECSTPRPSLNQPFHYPTPSLSCITPIIHRGNVAFSTTGGYQPPINKDSLIVSQTTPFQGASVLSTPIQRDTDYSHNQARVSMIAPLDVTPAHRKQVRFASPVLNKKMKILVTYPSSPVKGILQTATPSQLPAYDGGRSTMNLFENPLSIFHSEKEEDKGTTITQPYQEETPAMIVANSEQTPGKRLTTFFVNSPIRPHATNENTGEESPISNNDARPISATRKRKHVFSRPRNTESSFGKTFLNSRNSYYGRVAYCHCRTIVRKLKIRDAETQTSP